jgi:S1-C subfamily serine protease
VSVSTILITLALALQSASSPAGVSRRTPVVRAVERVAPAVVNISAEQVTEQRISPFGGLIRDPFFERFFEDFDVPELRRRVKSTSLGSGFIVDDKGHVLTNAHVVERAAKIRITLSDKRSFPADRLASDPNSDLAVLKIRDAAGLPQIQMGTSRDLMVGETVIAIGNPFGLSHSVTTGVISATRRSLRTEGREYRDFIQTDASINPGNSGGPLVNIEGEVIGVNTAIVQAAEGIGFAIRIDKARRILSDLLEFGRVHGVWMGVDVQTVTSKLARALGMGEMPGVVVTRVEKDGPGAKAGLERGDVITSLGERVVEDEGTFRAAVDDAGRGASLVLKGLRDAKPIEMTVILTEPPPDLADRLLERSVGLRLAVKPRGIVVSEVRAGSPAEQAGLRPGDLILKIGGTPVRTLEDLREAILDARSRGQVRITAQRGRSAVTFRFPFP